MKRKGVLLVNLGSPDSPSVPDVRKYLREFLMDERVLDAPWPVRFCIVNFAILPFRPSQSAEAYRSVWRQDGSPLIAISRQLRDLVAARTTLPVELAMRYQSPSIPAALGRLHSQGVEELLLIPMFPHYAMSSYETAVVRVRQVAARMAPPLKIEVLPPYYDQSGYIRALVASAADYLRSGYDHLLFSFHGLPERHLRKLDPTGRHCLAREDCCSVSHPAQATCYRAQCFKTVAAFVQTAGVPAGKHSISFQSRLGRDPWLRPYTDHELKRLAGQGVKRLVVMCPAFVADCLETIEEIGIRGHETFRAAGGSELTLVPCLNTHPQWVEFLSDSIQRLTANPPAAP